MLTNLTEINAYIQSKYSKETLLRAGLIGFSGIAFLLVILFAYTTIANDFLLKSASKNLGMHSALIIDKPKERTPVLKDDERIKTVINKKEETEQATEEETAKKGALPKAPIGKIIQRSQHGLIPKISSDGLTPFDAYKRYVSLPQKTQPIIAIALSNVGNSKKLTNKLFEKVKSKNITLLVSPYTQNLQNTIDKARELGFETWLNIPFETKDYPYIDTGDQTILIRSSLTLNMQRLVWSLTQASGYAGVYGHIDKSFDHTEILIKSIFNYIFARGLGFFETNDTENKIPKLTSAIHKMPYQTNDLHITSFTADKMLPRLVNTAKINGTAIATIDLTSKTIAELSNWVKKIEKEGIQIVPISAIDDYIWAHHKKN